MRSILETIIVVFFLTAGAYFSNRAFEVGTATGFVVYMVAAAIEFALAFINVRSAVRRITLETMKEIFSTGKETV